MYQYQWNQEKSEGKKPIEELPPLPDSYEPNPNRTPEPEPYQKPKIISMKIFRKIAINSLE